MSACRKEVGKHFNAKQKKPKKKKNIKLNNFERERKKRTQKLNNFERRLNNFERRKQKIEKF